MLTWWYIFLGKCLKCLDSLYSPEVMAVPISPEIAIADLLSLTFESAIAYTENLLNQAANLSDADLQKAIAALMSTNI